MVVEPGLGLPDHWRTPSPAEAAELAAELRRELRRRHVLHGAKFRVLAKSNRTDDILIEVDGRAELATVHLTWQRKDRLPFPWTEWYASADEAFADRE
jgi:hypothetical protein